MLRRPVAGRSEVDRPAVLLQVGQEFLQGIGRDGRVDHQHQRNLGDQRNGREVLDGVVVELGVEMPADRVGGRGHEQRVAIALGARHRAGADGRARAGAVFDDDGLPPRLRELLRHGARHHVGRAAGRVWHDHRHGF
ncbi:hypothetical protein D3C85_1414020 [compost metagenome]